MVLLGGPDLLVGAELGEPTVAMEALVLIAVIHESGDEPPFLGVLIIEFDELFILFGGPGLDFALLQVRVFLFDFHFENTAFVIWRAHHHFFHYPFKL